MLVAVARSTVLGIFAVCVTASVAGAEIYRWEDASGELHLVSDLSDVPPEYRAAALAAANKTGPSQGTLNVISDSDDAPPPEMADPSENAEPTPAAQPAAEPTHGSDVEVITYESDGYTDDDTYADDEFIPAEESAVRPLEPPASDPRLERKVPEHPGSIR